MKLILIRLNIVNYNLLFVNLYSEKQLKDI